MLDVVDPHRLLEYFFRRAAVVRREAKHGDEVELKRVELGIGPQLEPVLARHEREVAAGVGVEVYGAEDLPIFRADRGGSRPGRTSVPVLARVANAGRKPALERRRPGAAENPEAEGTRVA